MTRERVLLFNVLVVAVCALVYELLCGTLASYLLGDAVLQFSLVLGTYLSAMGVGAWASRRLEPKAAQRYVQAELALALVGGLSVPLLLLGVEARVPLRPVLYATVFAVGVLVGLELPLLIHILRRRPTTLIHVDDMDRLDGLDRRGPRRQAGRHGSMFAATVARAFAYDYVGALAASVLFPLVLVPRLGLVRTSVLAGALNAAAALSATAVLRVARRRTLLAAGLAVLGVLGVAFVRAESWVSAAAE